MAMLLLLAMPIGILIAGVLLFAVGWRGRIVDDHPICRRCGFDLNGRPSASQVCSECGTDLNDLLSIRIGNREKRGGMLWAGAAIIALIVLVFASAGGAIYSKVNLNPYKPMWAMEWQAKNLSRPMADGALKEINSRLAAGKLTDAQIASTSDIALTFQGDRAVPWNPQWGDFVELARKQKKVTDAQWHQYADHAPDFQITFRPRVRRGDLLAYENIEGPSRVGRTYYPIFVADCEHGVISISGHEIHENDVVGRRQLDPGKWGVHGGGWFDLKPILDKLQDGPQAVTVSCDAIVYDSFKSKEPLGERHLEFTGSFILTPANEPTLKLIHDDSLRPAIEKGLKIKSISVNQGDPYTETTFDKIPVPLSYTMVIIDHGKDRIIGGFSWNPKSRSRSYGIFSKLQPLPPPAVDVIFRPNHEYPLRTFDIFEM